MLRVVGGGGADVADFVQYGLEFLVGGGGLCTGKGTVGGLCGQGYGAVEEVVDLRQGAICRLQISNTLAGVLCRLRRLTRNVGTKIVELIEVGPAHTGGDTLAFVPADKTIFTGDILFIHGHPISAADPAHTKIVGNFLLDYSHKRVSCVGYPWWDRLTKAHTQIECDSDVWDQVEKLIREKLDARNKPSERAAVARAAAPVN